jgi:hypothetical protein
MWFGGIFVRAVFSVVMTIFHDRAFLANWPMRVLAVRERKLSLPRPSRSGRSP